MALNSITYLIFLPFIYFAYIVTPNRYKNLLLLIASYIFYAWWDARFLSLIAISTSINYCCGLLMNSEKITFNNRLTVSLWVICICFISLLIDFRLLSYADTISSLIFPWSILVGDKSKWIIFIAVVLCVILCNLMYKQIQMHIGSKNRFYFFIAGVIADLIILGFFKYYNFFIDNMELLIKSLNMDSARFHLNIILPIGISFYTFKGISYAVDVYRGQLEPEKSYINFSLFIAFFPSLLAGPLDRAKNFLDQFSIVRKHTAAGIYEALHLVIYGLFKKIVIADGVVRTVNSVFDSSGQPSWIDIVIATVLFTIQIYCDFSGYTDIARGSAKFFGIELMINFNLPYFSKNSREFWNRWHISLSRWLRDYLYIPLGGNRCGVSKTYRNLMLTMILGGLWHGAAWNFIFWGFYHGIILCLHRAIDVFKSTTASRCAPIINAMKTIFFFFVISYGWLLFRTPSLEKLVNFSSIIIYDFGNLAFSAMRPRAAALIGVVLLACIEVIEYLHKGELFYKKLPMPAWTAVYSLMIFVFSLGLGNESGQFIYFKF